MESSVRENIAATLDPSTFWEQVATSRWGLYVTGVEHEALLKAHHMAGTPTKALEVGCEGGRWSKLLADLGWRMSCADVNPKALDVCRQRIPSANCIQVSASDRTLPAETSSLGLILCCECFPVMDSEWFLPEAKRVLADGGLVVGVLLNRRSPRGVFVHAKEVLTRKPFRHYRISHAEFSKRSARAGFEIVHARGFCWFPFSRLSNSPLVPLATFLERALGLSRLVSLSPWIVFVARKIPGT